MVFESNEKPPSPEDGRSGKLKATMDLALRLAATSTGQTIDDIQNTYEVSRRTAERMRDLVEELFGELERNPDGRHVRFRLPLSKGMNFITAPTAEELAELINLTEAMKGRDPARADLLGSLSRKIEAAMRQKDRIRLDPDIEVHLSTEVWAHVPGPARLCKPNVLTTIRHALLTSRTLEVTYRKVGDETCRVHRLVPYGLILGPRHYLVAGFSDNAEPRNLRLDRVDTAIELDDIANRPESFDLKAYARRSFGFYQEEPQRIELAFDPAAAAEARETTFHPLQEMQELEGGRLLVTFEAGGLLELARFVARWRGNVEVMQPERLRDLLLQEH